MDLIAPRSHSTYSLQPGKGRYGSPQLVQTLFSEMHSAARVNIEDWCCIRMRVTEIDAHDDVMNR